MSTFRILFTLALCAVVVTSAGKAWSSVAPKTPATGTPSTMYDFVIVNNDCRSLVAVVVEVNDPKKQPVSSLPAESISFVCSRDKRKMRCQSKADDPKAKVVNVEYSIAQDTAALIVLNNSSGSEVVYINPSAHTAVFVSRAFHVSENPPVPLVMSKMCKGYYLTHDEAEALKKRRQ